MAIYPQDFLPRNIGEIAFADEGAPLSSLGEIHENSRFVYADPRAGFGNRMGALASVYAYAKISGRILIIDWTKKDDTGMAICLFSGDRYKCSNLYKRYADKNFHTLLPKW